MEWKPLELLTYDDLLKNPVWEHRYNNGREEVRPTNLTMINDDPNRGFIVRTRFQFANGTEAFGYSSPQDPSGLDYIQPTVMTNQGQWNIFTGEGKPSGTEKGLFPMKCESLVECEGQFWKATIDKDPTNG